MGHPPFGGEMSTPGGFSGHVDARSGHHREGDTMMEHGLSDQQMSDLIGSIYDCVLEPSRWEGALNDIKAALNFETGTLHLTDLRRNHILINRSVGIEPYWLERQLE